MKHTTPTRLAWMVLCTTLFSFSVNPGGDSYTVYLGDKLIVQQHVTRQASVPSFTLAQNSISEPILVYYSHCGQIGKGRTITLKDDQQNILKDWRFTDATTGNPSMSLKVKEILALRSDGDSKFNLVYSSKELPEGRLLVTLVIKESTTTRSQ